MVRMVHAAVKFPQIHTLRRRCLRVLRGRRVLRARVEARELELGPRAGLRGRRCERGLWLRVRRFSPHHRRLNRGFQFPGKIQASNVVPTSNPTSVCADSEVELREVEELKVEEREVEPLGRPKACSEATGRLPEWVCGECGWCGWYGRP